MFIAKNNDLIILAKDTREELEQALQFMVYDTIEETDVNYKLVKGSYITEEQEAQQEKERIQELKMTRSDFFDGTIMAWGVDEAALLPLIESMVNSMPLDDRLKLKAMNNFKNALNFYRKHDLFNLLVNIPLQLSESVQVIITDEHLDKFFDEVAKGNKDSAWQYLPQPMAINQ